MASEGRAVLVCSPELHVRNHWVCFSHWPESILFREASRPGKERQTEKVGEGKSEGVGE